MSQSSAPIQNKSSLDVSPLYNTAASLDRITVEIDGHTYPLKQIGQLGMPSPQTILVNMSAYPEVSLAAHICRLTTASECC